MKVMFVSLGCDKNTTDTEAMLGLFYGWGYDFTDDENEAEIIIVNTCCFINDAKQESVDTLLEMAQLKESGKLKILIACGCLAQRYKDEIIDEIPEVDAVVGTSSYDRIANITDELRRRKKNGSNERISCFDNLDRLPVVKDKRVITTGGSYEYLKIAEGCDKCCTYCIIPKVRGPYRSVPMEELISQAEWLASQGIKELILVAQETGIYGIDIYGEKSLHRLLHKLCEIDGLEWIRILYCYPEEIDDNLIEAIKNEPKVCNYLDIPIQHADDDILKRMGRRTNRQDLIDIINKLRAQIPDICLRTTLITGFPGETKVQHEELLDFIDEVSFDRLGVFTYSAEEDTPASSFDGQIDEGVKEQRRSEIMELQQEISADCSAQFVGKTLKVMIEGKLTDENVYVGRTYRDAPDVDGYVFVNTDDQLMTGDFISVRITGSDEYDLMGEPDYEFTK